LTGAVAAAGAPAAANATLATSPQQLRRAEWALLYGNFTIGCGVMVTAGTLNDLAQGLAVSVATAGQLITVAALVMALGAPLLAALVAGFDRRRLLVAALLWYAAGHALCALLPGLGTLMPVRALCMLGAAVFTPQAAAAVSVMAAPAQRGRTITFVFLGWSLASVLGMPLSALAGEALGWRWAFGGVALASAVGALWVWRAMPDGVRPAALSRASWAQALTHPALLATVLVTAFSAAGQFTLWSYFAPYYRQVLGASAQQVSLLFLWFGALGVVGNVLIARRIDQLGAPRAVLLMLGCIALSLLLWPLGSGPLTMMLVSAPWALGCFSSNSAQQARLGLAAPLLAPALIALNSSAMYAGQAMGAASGGAIIAAATANSAAAGYGALHWVGLGWLLAAIALSLWATRALRRRPLGLGLAHG